MMKRVNRMVGTNILTVSINSFEGTENEVAGLTMLRTLTNPFCQWQVKQCWHYWCSVAHWLATGLEIHHQAVAQDVHVSCHSHLHLFKQKRYQIKTHIQ